MADVKEEMSALDRVNAYEVESFLRLYGAYPDTGPVKFKPTLEYSSKFADATKDPNYIHRKMQGLEQVISPGFLQTCAAILLSRKGMNDAHLNSTDYPFSLNECEMPLFVVTGKEYAANAVFNKVKNEADVEFRALGTPDTPNGPLFYRLHRRMFKSDPVEGRPEIRGELVYEGTFRITGEDSIQKFGQLVSDCFSSPVGLGSSESHLRALAGASSAVSSAIAEGKLNTPEEDLDIIYSGKQQFYLNVKRTLKLHDGIGMKLYAEGKERFGTQSGSIQPVRVSILGESSEGLVYHFNADLKSVDKRGVPLSIRKAFRPAKK